MKKKLGLGLAGLFESNKSESNNNSIQKIDIEKISIANWQPRKIFNQEHLEELASSIKEYGVLQPILLKQIGDSYEIIAGERRYRASKIANLTTIPALVVDFDDNKALAVSMIENIQRKDLSPIEQAEGFAFLIEKLGVTQEELSEKLGFSRSYIANYLRINSLSSTVKEKISDGSISMGHAKVLVNKKNAETLAQEIIEKKLTVRDLEDIVYKKEKQTIEDISNFEQLLSENLNNSKIKITLNKNFGNIKISFNSLEDLDSIIQKICF